MSTWAWPLPPAEFHTRMFPWRIMHAPLLGPYLLGRHNALAARGMVEAVTWSFIAHDKAALFGGGNSELALANPIAADLSDMRPSLLPGLALAAQRNADRGYPDIALFEVGQIFMGDRPHRVLYFWHMVGNRFLTLLSNMFTNLNLTDLETCYKAFRAPVLKSLNLREDRFGFEPEVTAKLAKARCRIYEVGISYNGRTYSEGKKVNWKDGFHAIYAIVRYNLFP